MCEEEIKYLINGCNLTPSLYTCIMDKFIWVEELVKFIDSKRFSELVQMEGLLTVRQVIRLGITHDNMREMNRRLYEGLNKKEFNSFINQHLDTTVNRSLGYGAEFTLKEYLKSL